MPRAVPVRRWHCASAVLPWCCSAFCFGAVGRTGYVQTIADCLLVLLGVLLGSWQDA
ncbi:MAG: hypothetical protein ACLSB9_19550 [Hydrogeniiclostridium mannosilyticum]